MFTSSNGRQVPNKKVKELLEVLLYHHKSVRRPDEFGVKLYQDALWSYESYGKVPVGKMGYILNRVHPKGRWSSYYSKVHQEGERTKKSHHLLDYFRQRPEELVLSTEGFGLNVKDEVKLYTFGSELAYDEWVMNVVYQEQLQLLTRLINKLTSDSPLRTLPKEIRVTLTKAIGRYFMALGSSLEHHEVILLGSLMKQHGVSDVYGVFDDP